MAPNTKLTNHFLKLPDELLLHITQFIKVNDIKSFTKACRYFRNLMGAKEWFEYYKSVEYDLDCMLFITCSEGNIELYKYLIDIKRVDPSRNHNYVIRLAASNGHLEIFKLLLADKRVDPSDDDNLAIDEAAQNGRLEIFKLLLADKRVDPSDRENRTIRISAGNGY